MYIFIMASPTMDYWFNYRISKPNMQIISKNKDYSDLVISTVY